VDPGWDDDDSEPLIDLDPAIRITDDLDALLEIFPAPIQESLKLQEDLEDLIEVVLDLGRRAEARFPEHFLYLNPTPVDRDILQHVVAHLGPFTKDNRAGIERTLHRISAIRNRRGEIIGLTCRVGRAVYGTIGIIRDLVDSGKSILILGRPGVGKTTLLREVARVLADHFSRRVVVVDTSNEIAGDGDIPHSGIGNARRMQVMEPALQHAVMIEAVENHMPEVIVVDEIGTEAEAYAARTIAERGVQLVATAHGNTLENLLMNPTLADLIGGIQAVTLSDEEARKRGTQKTVLERRSPPTFDILVEIHDKDTLALHDNLAEVVDLMLRGVNPRPEIRVRGRGGEVEVVQTTNRSELAAANTSESTFPSAPHRIPALGVRIFPFGVSRNRLDRAIRELEVGARVARTYETADLVLTLKGYTRKDSPKVQAIMRRRLPIYSIRSNTVSQIQEFLQGLFGLEQAAPVTPEEEEAAVREAEEGARKVAAGAHPIELAPRTASLRRLQHLVAERFDLRSRSTGTEPNRRVRIYRDN